MGCSEFVVVSVIGGGQDGDRFITCRRGLRDGARIRYYGGSHTLTRDAHTGQWEARPDRFERASRYGPTLFGLDEGASVSC